MCFSLAYYFDFSADTDCFTLFSFSTLLIVKQLGLLVRTVVMFGSGGCAATEIVWWTVLRRQRMALSANMNI